MLDGQISILLVEDDEEDFLLTQEIIEDIPNHRYKLSWASSYEEGLVAILGNSHDIYLVDYRLGKDNGLKLLEAAADRGLDRPFILLTGYNDRELDYEAMTSGAADFLVKDQLNADLLDRSIRYATQLNQTVNELRKSQERLNEAQALAHLGHFDWVLAAEVINWSDEHYRIFGLEPQSVQITFEKFLEFVDPEDIPRLKQEMEFLSRVGTYQESTYKIVLPDGKVKYLQGRSKAERNPLGKLIRLSGTTQDITPQIERSRNLLALEAAIENAAIPILFAELNNRISYVNQAYIKKWGHDTKNEVIGTSLEMVFETSEKAREIINALYEEGGWEGEDVARKKDGSLFYIYINAKMICDSKGNPLRVMGTFVDISDVKGMESALEKEKELSNLKSRFVSMASHEFRTPLTSILSSVSLIEMYGERGDTEKQKKHINRIKSSVSNLTSILNDFLSLEKLESGKVHFKPEKIELSEFIAEIKEEVKFIAQQDQKINHDHSGPATVEIDQHLVKNILINLLSNAIKYSPNGEDVELVTEVGNEYLVLKVKDRGIGIPDEDQALMFSRFFRASNAANIKGTGLGLTIVKRYLDLMGGTIDFTSQQNVGTTFEISIPNS